MNTTMTLNTTAEGLALTSTRALTTTSFPRKYVHSAFNNRQDALQAVGALRQAGFDGRDIYLLSYRDYEDALGRGQGFFSSLTSTDLDVYLDAARRGNLILAIRLANYGQVEQVRDLLAPHRAHLVRYVDAWTVAHLLP
ncbi:MAG TPA: hypothetical protein VFA41_17455 [Ktedonobacteraceae bacterium]|nr:hypothetical protein [Ktedonobacteraceae bacterium]